MDKTMDNPIEERVKTLELKVEFLENWKNAPFIQVTLPVILSIFLAASWNSFGFISLDKRIDSLEKRMNKVEVKMDKLAVRMDKLEMRMDKLEMKVERLESKMDRVLLELSNIKPELKKSN